MGRLRSVAQIRRGGLRRFAIRRAGPAVHRAVHADGRAASIAAAPRPGLRVSGKTEATMVLRGPPDPCSGRPSPRPSAPAVRAPRGALCARRPRTAGPGRADDRRLSSTWRHRESGCIGALPSRPLRRHRRIGASGTDPASLRRGVRSGERRRRRGRRRAAAAPGRTPGQGPEAARPARPRGALPEGLKTSGPPD